MAQILQAKYIAACREGRFEDAKVLRIAYINVTSKNKGATK